MDPSSFLDFWHIIRVYNFALVAHVMSKHMMSQEVGAHPLPPPPTQREILDPPPDNDLDMTLTTILP